MSTFVIRVELHSATWQDYDTLHQEMGKEGFSRTIRSDDGVVYQLPTAEYAATSSGTTAQVLEAAKQAATRTGKSFGVIASQTMNSSWIGLQRT